MTVHDMPRSRRFRRLTAVLTASLLGVTLAACGADADGDSGSGDKITAIQTSPSAVAFPEMWVAKELGYFEDEDLDVELIANVQRGTVENAIKLGRVDFGGSSQLMVPDAANDESLRFFMVDKNWLFDIFALGDSPLQSAEDLEGARIGMRAATDELIISIMLNQIGLTEDDYETVVVGESGALGIALERGDIDAAAGTIVDQAQLRAAGFDLTLLSPEGTEDLYNGGIMTTVDTMENDPELVERFGRAYAKASVFIRANPEAAIDVLSEAVPEAVEDPEAALSILELFLENDQALYEDKFESDPAVWQEIVDLHYESGTVSEPYDASRLFTNDFLDAIWNFDIQEIEESAQEWGN